ncbi:MAG: hypothetical protein H6721_00125 [Sandaracinus sp.]|nr:hypothetical protein [Myxococcales bacterium]MCB9599990.1 hypothetical protein [Sandaracinus sp.]MCA9611515.1 hypothetical protein [Myxococcales bacterium]MCB9614456.1 hypothetical protein [Sandaracinus sp.]MCB9618598.1 hypothetical protein [Sandaracinus sp.]
MKRRGTWGAIVFAVIGLSLIGCGPPWAVIQQSGPPSALQGASQITVAVDFSQLTFDGKNLDQMMAERNPEEQAALNDVLTTLALAFPAALAERVNVPVVAAQGPPQPGEVRCTAVFVEGDLGKYMIVFARNSWLTTNLVWSVGGEEVDVIQTRVVVEANVDQPAIIQRVRIASTQTGNLGANFFTREQSR